MATAFLIKKWKQFFQLVDADNDNLITLEDGDKFAERFAATHKFDEDKTKQVIDKNRSVWKTVILLGGDTGSVEEYVSKMTEKFNASPEALRKELKESMETLLKILEIKSDGFVSTEKLLVIFYAMGVGNIVGETFLARFPQVNPGFIKTEDYVMSLIEHLINPDETVSNPVSEELQALSDAGVF